jgi:blocked early in transport 1
MDTSRGFLSGTVDKFKMVRIVRHKYACLSALIIFYWPINVQVNIIQVFETKSSRRMGTFAASFVGLFLLVYYLTR